MNNSRVENTIDKVVSSKKEWVKPQMKNLEIVNTEANMNGWGGSDMGMYTS